MCNIDLECFDNTSVKEITLTETIDTITVRQFKALIEFYAVIKRAQSEYEPLDYALLQKSILEIECTTQLTDIRQRLFVLLTDTANQQLTCDKVLEKLIRDIWLSFYRSSISMFVYINSFSKQRSLKEEIDSFYHWQDSPNHTIIDILDYALAQLSEYYPETF